MPSFGHFPPTNGQFPGAPQAMPPGGPGPLTVGGGLPPATTGPSMPAHMYGQPQSMQQQPLL